MQSECGWGRDRTSAEHEVPRSYPECRWHMRKEIEHRVGTATRVIGAMRMEVLERRELKKATKMRMYNAMVIPTMLYGSQT